MPKRIYAIGDIHGDLKQLTEMHTRIENDLNGETDYTIIHIGDLVDRREDSRGVIELLMTGQNEGKPWQVLKGNHDRLFYWFLEDPARKDPQLRSDYDWLHHRMGGRTTLESYGVDASETRKVSDIVAEAIEKVPASHLDFLRSLKTSILCNNIAFVHAGVRPGIPLIDQTEDDLIWIRKGWHEITEQQEYLVVHGHTVIDEVTDYGNRINIDTGAAWGNEMSAIVIEGAKIWVLGKDGRRVLR